MESSSSTRSTWRTGKVSRTRENIVLNLFKIRKLNFVWSCFSSSSLQSSSRSPVRSGTAGRTWMFWVCPSGRISTSPPSRWDLSTTSWGWSGSSDLKLLQEQIIYVFLFQHLDFLTVKFWPDFSLRPSLRFRRRRNPTAGCRRGCWRSSANMHTPSTSQWVQFPDQNRVWEHHLGSDHWLRPISIQEHLVLFSFPWCIVLQMLEMVKLKVFCFPLLAKIMSSFSLKHKITQEKSNICYNFSWYTTTNTTTIILYYYQYYTTIKISSSSTSSSSLHHKQQVLRTNLNETV